MFTVTVRPSDTTLNTFTADYTGADVELWCACIPHKTEASLVPNCTLFLHTSTPDFHFTWLELIKPSYPEFCCFFFCPETLLRKSSGGAGHQTTHGDMVHIEIGRVHFPQETPKTTNCGCIDFLDNFSNAYGYLYHMMAISSNKLTRRLSVVAVAAAPYVFLRKRITSDGE